MIFGVLLLGSLQKVLFLHSTIILSYSFIRHKNIFHVIHNYKGSLFPNCNITSSSHNIVISLVSSLAYTIVRKKISPISPLVIVMYIIWFISNSLYTLYLRGFHPSITLPKSSLLHLFNQLHLIPSLLVILM